MGFEWIEKKQNVKKNKKNKIKKEIEKKVREEETIQRIFTNSDISVALSSCLWFSNDVGVDAGVKKRERKIEKGPSH